MRFILALLFTLNLISAKAEYNGYHIQFKVETKQGDTQIGYVYVASAYFNTDSINNTNYLIKALDQSGKEWLKRDSLVYFKERIKYEYRNVGDSLGPKNPIYTLDNRQIISAENIQSISVLDLIDYTYIISISSQLSIADTSWINTPPVQSFMAGGYLCYHQIFVHAPSKKVEAAIKAIKAIENATDPEEIDYHDGDDLDEKIWEIISTICREDKIVVISECTC